MNQAALCLEWPAQHEVLLLTLLVQGQGTTDPVGLRAAMHHAIESGRLPLPAVTADRAPRAEVHTPAIVRPRQRTRGAA